MSAEKLNKWAELLLDTGKRNNLIHFKDTKKGSVEILFPDFVTLFNRADHSAVFEVYDPKLEDEEEDFDFLDEDVEETQNGKRIPKDVYLNAYKGKLKKNQILVYNAVNKPLSALKDISKKARSAVEETGVNIAYIAFGFIHWCEPEHPQTFMRAPILLAPITIENESSIEPFHVKITDDEIIVNPTFAFKLQNEYGIKLPEFDDDLGIEGYFESIEALICKLKWTVSTECKIGIFSFLKLNMYKDLKDNAPTIAKHQSVRALLGDLGAGATLTEDEGDDVDLLDLHNVVDADSSQAEAIAMALRGKSFVLQGPPGTGKSQTITNVIAECLLHGKKVLFVSEKLAALNVVYEKLKNAGLEEFCLELHSHKANKKQVIEELCHTLKLQKSGVSGQAERELKAKKDAQHTLDAYAEELHKVRPIIGKTLYELYEETATYRSAPDLQFVVYDLKNKGEDYLEKAESALSRYVDYIPSVGYDYRENIWYGYTSTDVSYQAVMELKADLLSVAELGRALQEISNRTDERFNLPANTLARARVLQKFLALAKDSRFITPSLLVSSTLHKTLTALKEMQALAKVVLEKKAVLDKTFDEDVYKLDGQALHKKVTKEFNAFFPRLFSGEYKRIAKEIRLCKKDGTRARYDEVRNTLDTLRVYQQKLAEFNALQRTIAKYLNTAYQGVDTDFARCLQELQALESVQAQGARFGKLAVMKNEEFSAEQPLFKQLYEQYTKAFERYGDAERRITACFDLRAFDMQNVSLLTLIKKCENCHENADNLDNWQEFTKLLQLLKGLDLLSYVNYAIVNKVKPEDVVGAYKKAFYLQWVDAVLRESPTLVSLARVIHDETVKRFKEKDELHFEINKAKIKATLSAQRPKLDMVAQGSSIAILLREGEKKRKQKGIRVLLSEIGDLAQTLKPCFLMSPLSVSTYLGADMQFDVVIFDEASQIFPQDAVGAIYRGKQLIVVGDSKQMPPSNFFNASTETDGEDEDEDVTDFESILDLCATSFPQRRLKWHYRSRFEPLISFSNKHFYDGDLVTFPSAKTDKDGIGVDFVYVDDGVFDRQTKTNRREAEKIVDMVFEHIDKYPERSLGVVAFSVSQQTLIDRLIAKRRLTCPSKDWFFKSDKPEAFFVKNLETVQGDERDTILFSVAYAKDASGKLLLNFGPINREGGERRLNVAVTRAKYNVKLIASMRHTDIDLSGSKSVGARLLRDYLDYAKNGEIALERASFENPFERWHSELKTEIGDFLREKGYEVDTDVGCSSFKLDLAVKYPNSPDYAITIECDGATYRQSKTARDRDRLRQDVLERMGWKFYRIWSTDWFRNKRVEKERLLTAVKSAVESAPKKPQPTPVSETSFEETVVDNHFTFPKYEMADEVFFSNAFKGDIPRVIRAILEVESPLSEEWLLKRIVFLFDGREKVTAVVRDAFNRLLWNCQSQGIVRRNGFLYLQGKPLPTLRVPAHGATPREIKHIPIEELASGLQELLKQNVTAEKSGLFKLLVEQLGFSRIGDAVSARLEQALKLLAKDVEINGDTLSLK